MSETLLNIVELIKTNPEEIRESDLQKIQRAVQETCIPLFKSGVERPCEASDFETVLPDIERRLQNLVIIFSALKTVNKQIAINVIILCGEHACQNKWTSPSTIKLCKELTLIVTKLWRSETISHVVLDLFPAALLSLRPKLLRDTWKTYPAAVSCYEWLLFQVKSPSLGAHLSNVVPTALLILDDFVLENRICGIRCLEHITDNVTRTELSWHGHGEVIYKSLEPILHQREPSVIEPLIACLLVVLGKVEGGYIKEDTSYEWSKYDEVIEKLLMYMEVEDKLDLRLAYIKSLPRVMEATGLALCRWNSHLLRVLARYLEVARFSERQETRYAVQAVEVFLCCCWPTVPHHAETILQMLFRLLYDTTEGPAKEEDKEIINTIEVCLVLLLKLAAKESEVLCAEIRTKARFNERFTAVIDRVFE